MAKIKGSEFGGVPGRIPPLPHELSPEEEHRLVRAIPLDDEVSTVEDMRVAEAVMEGRGDLLNPDEFTGDESLRTDEGVLPGAVRPAP